MDEEPTQEALAHRARGTAPVRVLVTGVETDAETDPETDRDADSSAGGAPGGAQGGVAGCLPRRVILPSSRVELRCEALTGRGPDPADRLRRLLTPRGAERVDAVLHVIPDDHATSIVLMSAGPSLRPAGAGAAGAPATHGAPAKRGSEASPGTIWAAPVLAGRLQAAHLPVTLAEDPEIAVGADGARGADNPVAAMARERLAATLEILDARTPPPDEESRGPVLVGLAVVPPDRTMPVDRVRDVLIALIGELADQVARGRAARSGAGRLSVPRGARALRIGLTGGIGSGKSTAARLLARRGATVVDADALSREVVAPGTPGLAAVVQRFGTGIVAQDGSLDRRALAAVVFQDPDARADLERIILPQVALASAARMEEAGAGGVAVYDVPLLVESAMADLFDGVIVVEAPLDLRLARLARRGLPEAEARARIAQQASDAQRRAIADVLLRNDGAPSALEERIERVWREQLQPGPSGAQ